MTTNFFEMKTERNVYISCPAWTEWQLATYDWEQNILSEVRKRSELRDRTRSAKFLDAWDFIRFSTSQKYYSVYLFRLHVVQRNG